ncbi:hypothetical protein D9C73_003418 [Collichthys lucidus]|uniref:Uncharacterized protein n=1 Tax=Collichthys lucidus TaxID=240159 RepID=A0A4U5U563_COLLU|nr:hypothetical protein D9C73_003418 [Collichthys lucidus]
MDEVQGDTSEKHSPSQTLVEWQSSENEDTEQPSCSTYAPESVAGNLSFSQIRTNPSSSFPAVSKRPQCDVDQASPASKLDVIVIKSLPRAAEDSSSSGALSSVRGGDDGAEEVTPFIGQSNVAGRSQYQPLLCIQISEPSSEAMFQGNMHNHIMTGNRISTFNNPPVTMGTVDSQQQETQHSWSGIRPIDSIHFPSQNHLYQASSSQNQDSGSAQSLQQPCLPYACTFCSLFFFGFTLECESLTVYISLPLDDDLYPAEWKQIGADCGAGGSPEMLTSRHGGMMKCCHFGTKSTKLYKWWNPGPAPLDAQQQVVKDGPQSFRFWGTQVLVLWGMQEKEVRLQ